MISGNRGGWLIAFGGRLEGEDERALPPARVAPRDDEAFEKVPLGQGQALVEKMFEARHLYVRLADGGITPEPADDERAFLKCGFHLFSSRYAEAVRGAAGRRKKVASGKRT